MENIVKNTKSELKKKCGYIKGGLYQMYVEWMLNLQKQNSNFFPQVREMCAVS